MKTSLTHRLPCLLLTRQIIYRNPCPCTDPESFNLSFRESKNNNVRVNNYTWRESNKKTKNQRNKAWPVKINMEKNITLQNFFVDQLLNLNL